MSLLISHEHKVTGLGSGSKLSPAVQCIAMVFLKVLEDKTKVIQYERTADSWRKYVAGTLGKSPQE